MTTTTNSHDQLRRDSFRAWVEKLPGKLGEAIDLTGIGARNIERMYSGARVPPRGMFDTLAKHARRNGWTDLAADLDRAGEAHDA